MPVLVVPPFFAPNAGIIDRMAALPEAVPGTRPEIQPQARLECASGGQLDFVRGA
jgi:hypothetical protein